MKSLLTISTLIFTVMFSSTSFAEWTKAGENANGIYYVDFERIRKHNGFVYYWVLVDFLAPTEGGQLSGKVYKQGDCKVFRHKFLSFVHHNQPMGRDTGKSNSPENPEWKYPPPGSMWEITQQAVCNR